MVEEEVEKKETPKEKKPKQRLVKLLSIAGFIIIVIVMILISIYSEISTGWIFGIIIFAAILFGIIFFAFEIPKLFNKVKKKGFLDDKLPPQITISEAQKISRRILLGRDYGDKILTVIDEGTEEHGKNLKQNIYFMHCEGKFYNNGIKTKYFIGINMHYPTTNKRVIINPTIQQMSKAKKLLTTSPEDDPDEETIEEKDPWGTERIIKKIKRRERYKRDKEKKEDLE